MWIPERISKNSGQAAAFTAETAFSDGKSVRLSGSQSTAVQFLPYGVESVPPKGERACALESGRTLCVIGYEGGAQLS